MTTRGRRNRVALSWGALFAGVVALGAAATVAAAVGGVEASTEVNAFSGAFQTRVPIGAPAFRGIEPRLALQYSSTGGNGFVGVGWSLSGMSVIERASPGRGAPGYDAHDVFLLDSNELIPSCTTFGGTHCTRIQSYQRITWDGTNNRWYVWAKDGTKSTYTARLSGGGGTYRWMLSEVRDTKNNVVVYNAYCGGSDCYLDNVSYNGVVVKLYREARTDDIRYALGGAMATTAYRLKSIGVTVGGAQVRTYSLTYATSAMTARSLLTSVRQYGADATVDATGAVTAGTSLPAVTFAAATGTMGFSASYWSGMGDMAENRVGDFNGDGKTDHLQHVEGQGWRVCLSTGTSFSCSIWSTGAPLSHNLVGDFDGDGRSDLLQYAGTGVGWQVCRSTGTSFSCSVWSGMGEWSENMVGDFNGDGRSDHIQYKPDEGWRVCLSTGSGFTCPIWSTGAQLTENRIGDFDGDGKSDLLQYAGAGIGWQVCRSTGASFSCAVWSGMGDMAENMVGDFNGDGKADHLQYVADQGWRVCQSTGSSFSCGIWTTGAQLTYNLLGDFNGDGRSDLLQYAGAGIGWQVCRSTGSAFDCAVWSGAGNMAENMVGDFDGDGVSDYVQYVAGEGWRVSRSRAVPEAMITLANGLDGTTAVDYAPSSSWTNTYLPVGMVFQTVSSVTTNDGRGDEQTTNYAYQGARWRDATADDPAREFLGFRQASTALAATGAYSETYYWQRAGTIAKPEVIYKRKANGAIMSFDKFVFSENADPPYTSLATQAWAYECNGDGVVDANHNYVSGCRRLLATYEWDAYANLVTEYQYGDYDDPYDNRAAVRSFVPNTTTYVVGLPAYEEVRAGCSKTGTLLARTRFFYDGATSEATAPTEGKLTRKGVWNDQTGGYVEHSFGYDSYGNGTSVTDPLGVTVTKAYDSTYHILTVSVTNALGHVTQTTWNEELGVPLTQTDVNGYVTTHAYDVFGRGTLTTSADGAQVKVQHLYYGTVGSQRVRTSKLLPGSVWVWDDVYFDGLGRAYKVVSSTGVTQDTIYGATGKEWKRSLPYVSGETVRYDVTTYDDVGRPLTTTSPEGAVITQAYGDASTTVTDPSGNVRSTWFDAFRRPTKVREVIGAVNHDTLFYYDRLGRRTKSVDAAGHSTVATYDSLGRVLQRSDPDQGLWTYGYDAMGRLTREVDALAKVTAIGYDTLGRATRRTYHDGTYDAYTFDEAGRGAAKGRLTTAVSTSGVTTRAYYDLMGRRTKFEEVVDATTYALSHTYDVAGRLVTATYPDGEVVTYGYGTSGLATGKIVSVTGSAAGTLLSGVGYTSKGQISSLTHGNGVTTTLGFDAYGERVYSVAIGSLATLTYRYDNLGRVTSMTAPTLTKSNWTYGYDTIGRLTRATNTLDGTKTETFGYDAIGRMTTSSRVGTYTYGSAAHVHAVTVAGANTYTYDANGNLLSGAGRTLTFGLDHRPASIVYGGATTSFVYSAQGVRVKKTGASGSVRYVGGVYENRAGAVTKYYFAGGLRVAKRDVNGNQYLHTDHLGSTRLITNASGTEVQRYEYAPFGSLINSSGTRPDSHRFTGQEADDETGLTFFQARYYDPSLGRFIQPDSLVPGANSPQQFDPYAYATNSPINFVDPSGHAPAAIALVCIGAGAAAYVGVISWTVATLIIGTALTFSTNPVLQTIGMVMAGWAGGSIFGGPAWFGLSPGQTGALVALAQSPISPLDPTIKKAIGWAYTVSGFVTTITQGKTLDLGHGNALADSKLGHALVEWYATPAMRPGHLAAALWGSFASGVKFTAIGWVAAYLTSTWGTGGRYAVAFLGRMMVLGTNGASGVLGALGATYDLAYTLKHPDGRVYDLSGGAGTDETTFTFYYHTGYESADFALGRQHIRVWDQGRGGFWELGDARAGFFGPGLGWGGWISTQKVTVILSPGDAAAFRGALTTGAQSGGRYQGYHADSYTYISASLQAITGTSAADLHINPGLIHW